MRFISSLRGLNFSFKCCRITRCIVRCNTMVTVVLVFRATRYTRYTQTDIFPCCLVRHLFYFLIFYTDPILREEIPSMVQCSHHISIFTTDGVSLLPYSRVATTDLSKSFLSASPKKAAQNKSEHCVPQSKGHCCSETTQTFPCLTCTSNQSRFLAINFFIDKVASLKNELIMGLINGTAKVPMAPAPFAKEYMSKITSSLFANETRKRSSPDNRCPSTVEQAI